MIKVTMEEIVNTQEALQELSQHVMNGKIAFQIARLIRELNKEYQTFYETRTTLLKKYGSSNEDNTFTIPNAKIKDFNQEMEKILKEEIEINAELIPQNVLESISFTPDQIVKLFPLIE